MFSRTLVPFEFKGRRFGYFPADVCENGHEYFTQESRESIQTIAKALGLWGSATASTAQPAYPRTTDRPLEWCEVWRESESTPSSVTTIGAFGHEIRKKLAVASAPS